MRIISKFALSLFLAATLFLLNGCVNEGLEVTETIITPNSQALITTSVHGKILNEAGDPISGAFVRLESVADDMSVRTDNNGNFEFLRYENRGESAYIIVEAPGYFDGFRRVSLVPNNFNYTVVKLYDKEIVGSFGSAEGGSVATSEGMQVTMPANSVVDANGNDYAGEVRVAMAWVDPTAPDLPARMIGDLSGVTLDGTTAALSTYGMAFVELLDGSGNELQVRDGQQAELSFPLPADRTPAPTQTVPLWSYDEVDGTWIEESFAVLENGNYVGNVSHFSAWNVDYKGEVIAVNGCVVVANQARQTNLRAQVFICSDLIGTRGGFICPDGKFRFYNFPKDEEFTIKIKDECGNTVFEEMYGPYSVDTDLGVIDISLNNPNYTSIVGTAVDCNDQPILDGYVRFESNTGDVFYTSIDTGNFEIGLVDCGDLQSVVMTVFDVENLKMSTEQSITIAPGAIDVGEVVVCDELDEFLILEIDGVLNLTFLEPYFRGDRLDFGGVNETDSLMYSQAYFNGLNPDPLVPGTYAMDTIDVYTEGPVSSISAYNLIPYDVTFTEYSTNVDDIIRGSFTADVEVFENQSPLGILELNGTFKIRRE